MYEQAETIRASQPRGTEWQETQRRLNNVQGRAESLTSGMRHLREHLFGPRPEAMPPGKGTGQVAVPRGAFGMIEDALDTLERTLSEADNMLAEVNKRLEP